jgi:iron-sulfur cluster assembly accessory protein
MSERRDKAISKVGALRRRKLLHLGKNIRNGLGHRKKYIRRVLYGKLDILVPTQNVRLVVDPKSALFVSGSVLDYSEDLQKGGFKVTNPNAVAHCSCGESFAV